MTNWDQCPAVERHPDKLSRGVGVHRERVSPCQLYSTTSKTVRQLSSSSNGSPEVDRRQVEAVLAHVEAFGIQTPANGFEWQRTLELISLFDQIRTPRLKDLEQVTWSGTLLNCTAYDLAGGPQP